MRKQMSIKAKPEKTHVDDFVTFGLNSNATPFRTSEGEKYARFFFMLHRLHAMMQVDFRKWIEPHQLYCTYRGDRYRVTGASRMGDIWLAKDFSQDRGYDHRVMVDDVTDWGSTPEVTAEVNG